MRGLGGKRARETRSSGSAVGSCCVCERAVGEQRKCEALANLARGGEMRAARGWNERRESSLETSAGRGKEKLCYTHVV